MISFTDACSTKYATKMPSVVLNHRRKAESMIEVAFHHSVNGKNIIQITCNGGSRPNFSPKLEPILRSMNEHAL